MTHSSSLDRLARLPTRALIVAAVLAASAAMPDARAEAQLLKKIKGKVTPTASADTGLRSTTAAAAESTATAAADSQRVADSSTAKKTGRMGALGRAAAKANQAATAIERQTGVSKATMAKAALAGTGVGAAAMLAQPGGSSAKAQAAQAAGQVLLSGVKTPQAGSATTNAAVNAAVNAAMAGTSRQSSAAEMAMMQGAMMPGATMQPGANAELARLQQEIMQLAMRASAGDQGAQRQFMRFQAELTLAATTLATVAPGDQLRASLAMQRQALQCATSGSGCKVAP